MGCPCEDPKTGEVKDVPAKTKEMVYRVQAPQFKNAILTDSNKDIPRTIKGHSLSGKKKVS